MNHKGKTRGYCLHLLRQLWCLSSHCHFSAAGGFVGHSLFLQSKTVKTHWSNRISNGTNHVHKSVKNNQLPGNIQGMFSQREGKYNLTGLFYFKNVKVRTTRKSFCVSVYGVKLWNCLNEELKQYPNIEQFKKKYKNMIFKRYEGASA